MDIKREADIEIVGTQYDNRAVNHKGLTLGQQLIMHQERNNTHDKNAILMMTHDGKELGYIPKGYASIYSPAMDSGRYSFSAVITKTEYEPSRPILIVKIIADFSSNNEEEVEKSFIALIGSFLSAYSNSKHKYLSFIEAETIEHEELIKTLNTVRIFSKLVKASLDVASTYNIAASAEGMQSIDEIIHNISILKADIGDVLKKIQKEYNESLDIEDEEEYNNAQRSIREKRKKFRQFNELLESFSDITNNADLESNTIQCNPPEIIQEEKQDSNSVEINKDTSQEIEDKSVFLEILAQNEPKEATNSHPVIIEQDAQQDKASDLHRDLSEKAFMTWLTTVGGIAESTAKTYTTSVHYVESLFKSLYNDKKLIIDARSINEAREVILTISTHPEFIKANAKKHNSMIASLNKFISFANIDMEPLENKSSSKISEKKNPNDKIHEFVEFDDIANCRGIKPHLLVFDNKNYIANQWSRIYKTFVSLLHSNYQYKNILLKYLDKPLYGKCVDFVKLSSLDKLRRPIQIADDFFAEGNLSMVDIVRHIDALMDACNIADSRVRIECLAENGVDIVTLCKKATSKDITTVKNEEKPAVINTTHELDLSYNSPSAVSENTSFTPDLSKPFSVKNAMIEILSSDANDINEYRKHNSGISSADLKLLIEKYYNKSLQIFDITKELMTDKIFKYVGKGSYALIDDFQKLTNDTEVNTKNTESNFVAPIARRNQAMDKIFQDTRSLEKTTESDTDISSAIIDIIKENSEKLQYKDGFGTYEIKCLLFNKGIKNVTEDEIYQLLSSNKQLTEIEDGYYVLKDESSNSSYRIDATPINKTAIEDNTINIPYESDEIIVENILLNKKRIKIYNASEALIKVCEMAIKYKPFSMARITNQNINIAGKDVFCRSAVPMDGYKKLSNDLQVLNIEKYADLNYITKCIKAYCDIEDDMIALLNE